MTAQDAAMLATSNQFGSTGLDVQDLAEPAVRNATLRAMHRFAGGMAAAVHDRLEQVVRYVDPEAVGPPSEDLGVVHDAAGVRPG